MLIPNEVFLTGGDKYESGAHKHMLHILQKFDTKQYRFYMLNWARRHNKSTLAINILIKEALKNPNSVYIYMAPTYGQAKRIQWDDPDMLFSYLPEECIMGRPNSSELKICLNNNSLIRLMGGENPGKIKGINCQGVVFDEWSEFSHQKYIWYEVFLPILRRDNKRWAMFTFTPKGQGEVYDMWNKAHCHEEWYVSELNAEQAGIIPKKELYELKNEMDPLLYSQEMMCSFICDEEMTFITSSMLESLKDVKITFPYVKKLISIDPALGGDECVIYYGENFKIEKQVIGHWNDSKHIAAEAFVLGQEKKCKNYVVDYIGLGEGVYSRLDDFKQNVIKCDARNKSNDMICYNKKAEMWWFVRKLVLEKKIPYPEDLELRRQICSVKFEFRNGLIIAEPKDKSKKNVGHSYDRAEAWIQFIYFMYKYIDSEIKLDSFDNYDDNTYEEYSESACM